MARAAHPDAMKPTRPGRTRTARPSMPPRFPFSGRYAAYTLFDLTGLLYLLVGFVALRAVWALGSGEAAWRELLSEFEHPLYVGFHALTLASVAFVAVRFFRLFPKAQPPRIGPLRPPPAPAITALLYTAWIAVAAAMTAILAGGIF
jgi:fumarate reductase subunit C